MAECRCNGCRLLGRVQERAWPRWEAIREERAQEEEMAEREIAIEQLRVAGRDTTANITADEIYHWYAGTVPMDVTSPIYNATISNLRGVQENEFFTPQADEQVNAPTVSAQRANFTWGELNRNGEQQEWRTR